MILSPPRFLFEQGGGNPGDPDTYTAPSGVPQPLIWLSPRDVTLNGSSEVTVMDNMGTGGATYDATPWGGNALCTITTPSDWGSKEVFNIPANGGSASGYTFASSTGVSLKTTMIITTYGDGTTATFGSFDGLISGPTGGADTIMELVGSGGNDDFFPNRPIGLIRNGLKSQSLLGVLPMDKEVYGSHNATGAVLGTLFVDNFSNTSRDWWGEAGDIMMWDVDLTAAQVQKVHDMLTDYYA